MSQDNDRDEWDELVSRMDRDDRVLQTVGDILFFAAMAALACLIWWLW